MPRVGAGWVSPDMRSHVLVLAGVESPLMALALACAHVRPWLGLLRRGDNYMGCQDPTLGYVIKKTDMGRRYRLPKKPWTSAFV